MIEHGDLRSTTCALVRDRFHKATRLLRLVWSASALRADAATMGTNCEAWLNLRRAANAVLHEAMLTKLLAESTTVIPAPATSGRGTAARSMYNHDKAGSLPHGQAVHFLHTFCSSGAHRAQHPWLLRPVRHYSLDSMEIDDSKEGSTAGHQSSSTKKRQMTLTPSGEWLTTWPCFSRPRKLTR